MSKKEQKIIKDKPGKKYSMDTAMNQMFTLVITQLLQGATSIQYNAIKDVHGKYISLVQAPLCFGYVGYQGESLMK